MSKRPSRSYQSPVRVHPGAMLQELVEERGLTLAQLSELTEIPEATLADLCAERVPVTEELAEKLDRTRIAKFIWLRLQEQYDTWRPKSKRFGLW